MVVTTGTLNNILQRWNVATNEEIIYAKKLLMPDDDPEYISFKVTAHPDLLNDRVCTSWFDIDIYELGLCVGYITIDTYTGYVRYYFDNT